MDVVDFIVVGSGCTGAMAAQTLLEEQPGSVLMLDAGVTQPDRYTIPDLDFTTLRKNDPKQYTYLLGKHGEGVGWGSVGKGEQLTPPRQHILNRTDELLPVVSKTFSAMESLGYGGLGIGWGIGCWQFSPPEQRAVGLSETAMPDAYRLVSSRIGISAVRDDANDYTIGTLDNYQSAARTDINHKNILDKFQDRKKHFTKQGFILGRAPLALLTKDVPGRKKYEYKDMDFYSDAGKSAWRPWITIESLKKKKQFMYRGNLLVISFKETRGVVRVTCLDITSHTEHIFYCRKLILCSGAFGSARIVLRSFQDTNTKLPILCNPYSYIPCLQPAFVGRRIAPRRLGFAQLSLFLDEDHDLFDTSMASLYSYHSLMLFRMVRQIPLNFDNARPILNYLLSGLVIMGIHQPDSTSKDKYLHLQPSKSSPTKDRLVMSYKQNASEQTERMRREKKYMRLMRNLKTYPLKRVDPGSGASIHYAGTLPFSKTNQPYTISPEGRLHGTRQVFVADGSGFRYLPAKGLTFSLMAQAHLVAKGVALHD